MNLQLEGPRQFQQPGLVGWLMRGRDNIGSDRAAWAKESKRGRQEKERREGLGDARAEIA